MSYSSTIVALASGAGRAGVAVLRLSGDKVRDVLQTICLPAALPKPRMASLRDIVDPKSGDLMDHALVLFFPAPHSFTGEDVAELHIHGGHALLNAMLKVLCSIDGVDLAEPGAFSRRAFENGKMDLTEAEAIADLVDAETSAQHRQALRQMDGALGKLYHDWADRLIHDLAYVEAEIDFADEDIPEDLSRDRLKDVSKVIEEISHHLDDHQRGEKIREGFMVALLGAPNAGKSSMLNALAQREAAIVDPTPGTTRDVIEIQLDLKGYPVALADTAGLRESADQIENEGVRRALKRAEQADLKLLVFDGTLPVEDDVTTWSLRDDDAFIIINKCDLIKDKATIAAPLLNQKNVFFVSAKTGDGLKALVQALIEAIDHRFVGGDQPALTRIRHRKALEDALSHLNRAVSAQETELCAEDLRLAVRSIGRITGRVDVEDILDIIFSSFCIGK